MTTVVQVCVFFIVDTGGNYVTNAALMTVAGKNKAMMHSFSFSAFLCRALNARNAIVSLHICARALTHANVMAKARTYRLAGASTPTRANVSACARAHTQTHTHARTHARTRTHTHTHLPF